MGEGGPFRVKPPWIRRDSLWAFERATDSCSSLILKESHFSFFQHSWLGERLLLNLKDALCTLLCSHCLFSVRPPSKARDIRVPHRLIILFRYRQRVRAVIFGAPPVRAPDAFWLLPALTTTHHRWAGIEADAKNAGGRRSSTCQAKCAIQAQTILAVFFFCVVVCLVSPGIEFSPLPCRVANKARRLRKKGHHRPCRSHPSSLTRTAKCQPRQGNPPSECNVATKTLQAKPPSRPFKMYAERLLLVAISPHPRAIQKVFEHLERLYPLLTKSVPIIPAPLNVRCFLRPRTKEYALLQTRTVI